MVYDLLHEYSKLAGVLKFILSNSNFFNVSFSYKMSLVPPWWVSSSNNRKFKERNKKITEKKPSYKSNQIKMNPNMINIIITKPTVKPVVIITSAEVTEKPINPTNQCSIM